MTDKRIKVTAKALERMAILQAFYSAIADEVSTKGTGLRALLDEGAFEGYLQDGIKSYDLWVRDDKVGTYTVTVRAGRPERTVPVVDDPARFRAWCEANDCMMPDESTAFERFAETGELPDGCELLTYPADPPRLSTTLRSDAMKVAEALGDELPAVVTELIAGGPQALPAGEVS